MRTTVDIDAPLLEELKRLSREEGRPLGRIVNDALALGLPRRTVPPPASPLEWATSPGVLRVDPLDKEAVYAILDRETGG